MAERFEYYNTGGTNCFSVWNQHFLCERFAPEISHLITYIRVYGCRDTSGFTTMHAEIRKDSEKGDILCSGTVLTNVWPRHSSHGWGTITLGAGAVLDAGVTYYMVQWCNWGLQGAWYWRTDLTGTYPRGRLSFSNNSGATWELYPAAYDTLFEEWGAPLPPAGSRLALPLVTEGII